MKNRAQAETEIQRSYKRFEALPEEEKVHHL